MVHDDNGVARTDNSSREEGLMGHFLKLTLTVAFFLVVSGTSCFATGTDHVGIVKLLAGDVTIERYNTPVKVTANMQVQKGDLVRTGADGKADMIFDDDTMISMGPNSRISIDDFLFQPSEKSFSFITRIIHGTVSYISGQIAKLAPGLVRIETPQATVGLRGTHVLIKVD